MKKSSYNFVKNIDIAFFKLYYLVAKICEINFIFAKYAHIVKKEKMLCHLCLHLSKED